MGSPCQEESWEGTMQIASTTHSEIRLTLEATVELLNSMADGDGDARRHLTERGFPRAAGAPDASIERFQRRLAELAPLVGSLPNSDAEVAAGRVNEHLTELTISPFLLAHDGVDLHMHWTPATAKFDDQVIADIVMALAQEICDNGTARFGRCGARDCTRLFYDGTRNRSRRFCTNPRCASRTHTADHRARNKSGETRLDN